MSSFASSEEPHLSSSSSVPFVGREAELSELCAALERVNTGNGQVALLIGEPGIGKTRLAQQFAAVARTCGARVLWSRCIEWDGAPAYWPWIQLVRTHVRDREPLALNLELGTGAADIAEIVPDIRETLPDVPPSIPIATEQARFRLFDSLTQFVQRAANTTPLVLIIDDLHWADPSSLLLLQFLAAEIAASSVLIVGTVRDVDLGPQHPVSQTLAELSRLLHTRRLALHGLAERQTRHLLSLMSGRIPSDSLVNSIYRQSGGNPFFIAELIRLLLDEQHAWDAENLAGRRVGVPASVRQVINQRLARLSTACQEVLTVAAVIGVQFSLTMLTRISGQPYDTVLSVLDEAVLARVVEVSEPRERYRFSHALIRDVLYDALGSARQVQLHAQTGAALEQLHAANPAPALDEIAYHYWQAAPGGMVGQALAAARRAGDHAMSRAAYEEAIVQYQRALHALTLLDHPDHEQRGELLLLLGEAQRSAGLPAARATFLDAAADAQQTDHPERLARAALGFAGGSMLTGIPDAAAVRLLRDAVEATEQRFPQFHARCLARLAIAVRHDSVRGLPNYSETLGSPWWRDIDTQTTLGPAALIALSQETVTVAQRGDDPEVLALSLHALHSAQQGIVDLETATRVAAEMEQAADASGNRELMATAYVWRTFEFLTEGDITTADHYLDRAERLVAELRQPYYAVILTNIRAHRALTSGRIEEGTTLAERAAELSRRIRIPPPAPAEAAAMLASFILREQRQLDVLEDMLQSLVTFYADTGNPGYRALMLAVLSVVHAEQDLPDAAQQAMKPFFAVLETPVALGPGSDLVYGASYLAEACYLLNAREAAGRVYPILAPHAPYNLTYGGNYMSRGAATYYLGLLASTLERYDAADQHFTDALAMNVQMGMPPFAARTQCAHAALLLTRGRPADDERAHALAQQALVTSRELGLLHTADWAQQLIQLVDAAGAAHQALVPATLGLSARELEVLRLVADGLSDRQIAETLYISHRTVSTHMTSILNKLGVSSRTAAVALAVRRSIV